MKKIIALCFIIVLTTSVGFATITTEKIYESRLGNVTFDHIVHKDQDCIACHTAINNAGGMNKEVGHQVCISCHTEKASPTIPTSCKACHVK